MDQSADKIREKNGRFAYVFAGLIFLLVTVTIVNITLGNVEIPFDRIVSILSGGGRESKEYTILMMIRLPRIIMAALLGGALALSGYLLQTFFNNPIAGPFVLGISSGAKLMVALTLIISLRSFAGISSLGMVVSSFGGSLLATLFILLISKK